MVRQTFSATHPLNSADKKNSETAGSNSDFPTISTTPKCCKHSPTAWRRWKYHFTKSTNHADEFTGRRVLVASGTNGVGETPPTGFSKAMRPLSQPLASRLTKRRI